jgi:hypothetical protein
LLNESVKSRVLEVFFAADVKETSRELKESGVTDEIASAVKETVK